MDVSPTKPCVPSNKTITASEIKHVPILHSRGVLGHLNGRECPNYPKVTLCEKQCQKSSPSTQAVSQMMRYTLCTCALEKKEKKQTNKTIKAKKQQYT